jgi:hypothetical protein
VVLEADPIPLRHSRGVFAVPAGVQAGIDEDPGVGCVLASPKVVSERIGHWNIGFFLQTYAHVLGDDDRDAAEQAAAFIIGTSLDQGDEKPAGD